MGSSEKKNILFIINPIAGGRNKSKIPDLIDQYLDKSIYTPNYAYTEYAGHGAELAEEAAGKNFEVIVAVGGDGTINEVATKATLHGKTLGIIPLGSGNGLARFLEIPLVVKNAIQLINSQEILAIDVAVMNGRYFFNVAGMGFDAQISHVFAHHKTRGLKTYVELGLKEAINYKLQSYRLEIDGVEMELEAFAISIANSSQYGNNVYISPKSSITDGLLEVCIIKPFPRFKLPILAYQMVTAKTHESDLVDILKAKHIKIYRNEDGPVHVDGEPYLMGKDIEIVLVPEKLKVITKKKS